MHLAPNYLSSVVYSGISSAGIKSKSLAGVEAGSVRKHLHHDAIEYYYSSVVSVADALNGIVNSFYTWSIVKLYYSVFYSLRAYLAVADHCIFYLNKTPFTIRAVPGATCKKLNGPTHKVVLDLFSSEFPSSVLISQDIDNIHPFAWMVDRREEANYKFPKFCEPKLPQCFKFLEANNLYRAIGEYISDVNNLYAFDPDHAVLAYPILVARETIRAIKAKCLFGIDPDDQGSIEKLIGKRSGHLTALSMQLVS